MHTHCTEGQSLSHDEGRVSQNAQLEKTTSGRQSQVCVCVCVSVCVCPI